MPTALAGIQVDLGPIQFNTVADDGTVWVLEDLEGWDGTDIRTTSTARESDHGSWAGNVYLTERVLTLTGSLSAPTPALLEAAVDRLLAAVSLTDTTLTVWETMPRQVTVRRSGKPLVARQGPYDAAVSLLVTAPDPRRYGTTLHTGTTHLPSITGGLAFPLAFPISFNATVNGGQITCRNLGNLPSRPVLTIAGPVSQPQVVATYPDGTTAVLSYTADLAAGEVLTLDTDARTATLAGGVSRRRFIAGTWPELPPGDTTLAFRSPSASPTATLTAAWRSAWI